MEQEAIYLKVKYFDKWSESTQFAEYRLRVMFTKQESPMYLYYADNSGTIRAKSTQPEVIGLSWGALKKVNLEGEDTEVPDVLYNVYFSSSASLEMTSSCAL